MVYAVGDKHQESFVISEEVVAKFAEFSQDYNPMHMPPVSGYMSAQ